MGRNPATNWMKPSSYTPPPIVIALSIAGLVVGLTVIGAKLDDYLRQPERANTRWNITLEGFRLNEIAQRQLMIQAMSSTLTTTEVEERFLSMFKYIEPADGKYEEHVFLSRNGNTFRLAMRPGTNTLQRLD